MRALLRCTQACLQILGVQSNWAVCSPIAAHNCLGSQLVVCPLLATLARVQAGTLHWFACASVLAAGGKLVRLQALDAAVSRCNDVLAAVRPSGFHAAAICLQLAAGCYACGAGMHHWNAQCDYCSTRRRLGVHGVCACQSQRGPQRDRAKAREGSHSMNPGTQTMVLVVGRRDCCGAAGCGCGDSIDGVCASLQT
jgi:hypothetical protein